jgi:hypothetical protein
MESACGEGGFVFGLGNAAGQYEVQACLGHGVAVDPVGTDRDVVPPFVQFPPNRQEGKQIPLRPDGRHHDMPSGH